MSSYFSNSTWHTLYFSSNGSSDSSIFTISIFYTKLSKTMRTYCDFDPFKKIIDIFFSGLFRKQRESQTRWPTWLICRPTFWYISSSVSTSWAISKFSALSWDFILLSILTFNFNSKFLKFYHSIGNSENRLAFTLCFCDWIIWTMSKNFKFVSPKQIFNWNFVDLLYLLILKMKLQ